MKLLAFAASNSSNSINRALVTYAAGRFGQGDLPEVEVDTLDINDYEMPIYSIDREKADGIPALAQELRAKIGAADAVAIAFPEHNGAAPAAWKNIFDWMSRIEGSVWQDKPLALMAATPGPRAGAGVLGGQVAAAPFMGGDLRGSLGIGRWQDSWDAEAGTLKNPEDVAAVDALMGALVAEKVAA